MPTGKDKAKARRTAKAPRLGKDAVPALMEAISRPRRVVEPSEPEKPVSEAVEWAGGDSESVEETQSEAPVAPPLPKTGDLRSLLLYLDDIRDRKLKLADSIEGLAHLDSDRDPAFRALKQKLDLLDGLEKAAERQTKLFHGNTLKTFGDIDAIRIEIVDFTGVTEHVEGDLK